MAATLAACTDDGAGPQIPPWEVSGMPLAVGNTWSYDLSFDVTFKYEDGTDALEPKHLTASGTRQITGTETIDGREYVVEMFSGDYGGGSPAVWWRRFRQEPDAFYQADVANSVPPGEFPPEEEIGDQVRLRFPLAAGDSWRLRSGSDAIILTVEAQDTLSLSIGDIPAWRIRIDVAAAGPDDYIRLWYGMEGLLRRETHTEFNASDGSGGEIVHVVTHDMEELASLKLVAASR